MNLVPAPCHRGMPGAEANPFREEDRIVLILRPATLKKVIETVCFRFFQNRSPKDKQAYTRIGY